MKAMFVLSMLGIVLAGAPAAAEEVHRHYHGVCDFTQPTWDCHPNMNGIDRWLVIGICGLVVRSAGLPSETTWDTCAPYAGAIMDAYGTPIQPAIYGRCVEVWQDANGSRGLQRDGSPGSPADHRILHACPLPALEQPCVEVRSDAIGASPGHRILQVCRPLLP